MLAILRHPRTRPAHGRRAPTLPVASALLAILAAAFPAVSDGTAEAQVPRGARAAQFATARRTRGVVRGVVMDTASQPVEGVRVELLPSPSHSLRAVTRSRGEFVIAPLTLGQYVLTIRALGYRPVEFVVTVTEEVTPNYEVILEPVPQELRAMRIVASPARIERLSGFVTRQRHGSGHFITAEEIERTRPARLTDMLQTVPGLIFTPWAGNGNFRRVFAKNGGPNGARCLISVYVDGTRLPDGWSVDDITPLDNIAGMEIYTRWMGTPPQFVYGGDDDRCGAIVLWTKDGRGYS